MFSWQVFVQHSHVPSAEGFLPPKFVSYPKIEESLYAAIQNEENRTDLPPFQNAVGTLFCRIDEGVVYLATLGRPTDIGLQLGKACYPCSSEGWRENVFISSVSSLSFLFLFLPCHSLSSLLSLFSLSGR